MNVLNQKRKGEEVEYRMSEIIGVDIKTLQNLRKQNLIPKDYYRCIQRGKYGQAITYLYKKKEMIKLIGELRYEGIVKRRRKKI